MAKLPNNTDDHPLTELITGLYKARYLIVAAYERSEIDNDDKTAALVEPLIKSHLVRRENDNRVRLNQRLQKVFDAALRKNRVAAINTDLGSELTAAEIAMQQLQESKRTGHIEETINAREEVEQHLFAIFDILDDGANAIFQRITSSYGLNDNTDSRKRENKMYNDQLKKLVESYNQMQVSLHDEPFTWDYEIQSFIGNINVHCITVLDRIRRAQKIISDNLFRIRQLEDRARKIRAVGEWIKNNPGYEFEKSRDQLDKHPFFRAITSIKVKAVPCLEDPEVERQCAEMVEKYTSQTPSPQREIKRPDSRLKDLDQEERTADPSPIASVIQSLLADCLDLAKPISASEFWSTRSAAPALRDICRGEFLYSLSSYMRSDSVIQGNLKKSDLIRLHFQTKPPYPKAGTHDLVDLYVCPATMTKDEIKETIG
jgi:hypothetical protein